MPSRKDKAASTEAKAGKASSNKSVVDTSATKVDGASMVLGYLKRQNRPYSAIEVSANLHNKVTKTQAVKILKELHDNTQIAAKTSGKAIVYHALQPNASASTGSDEDAGSSLMIGAEIIVLKTEIEELRAAEKTLKTKIQSFGAKQMTLAESQTMIKQHETERDELLERLTPLRAGQLKPVDKAEKDRVDRELKLWTARADARRKMWQDMWGQVTDSLDKKARQDLWDELNLEEEEEED